MGPHTGVNICLYSGTLVTEKFLNLEIFRKSFEKSSKKWPLLREKRKKIRIFLFFQLKSLEKFQVGSGKVLILKRNIYPWKKDHQKKDHG